jgi:chromatin segregation and condensation protein Rec8/ScpA/Scc1 (kleisin family)
MLKKNLNKKSLKENDDETISRKQGKNHHCLLFDRISKGSSRRTAVNMFFEILQLKTWDYIEVKQNISYGRIQILPGKRFQEDPPTSNVTMPPPPSRTKGTIQKPQINIPI